MKQETKIFPFAPENKISPRDKFTKNMNIIKRDIHLQNKELNL